MRMTIFGLSGHTTPSRLLAVADHLNSEYDFVIADVKSMENLAVTCQLERHAMCMTLVSRVDVPGVAVRIIVD